ncbi:MAG: short-chain dehydrogenase [Flaviaesturariibacter sp.]|nr:short-chain dehydrogenase [Flaviaesturariibacter sp.]
MNLSNNTVLITGGTSGIGLAFAKEFSKAGSTVIICGRRQDRLDAIAAEHPGIITRRCDLSIDADREALVAWAIATYPALNIVINNAGVQLLSDLTRPVDLARVREETETNFIAPVHLSSLFSGHLASRPESALVNISSGLAFVPIALMPVYCATKAAIHSFSLSLRYQLRGTNIKVFEIAPPAVDTELGHDRRSDKSESHGGMPVDAFIAEAMAALRDDVLEAPIGMAKHLHETREGSLDNLNGRFSGTLTNS